MLLRQLRQVFPAFDDFGYRSLTYRNLMNARDVSFTAGNVLRFLIRHYLYWGGRVLFFLPGILLLQKPELFRLAEALALSVSFAAACSLAGPAKNEAHIKNNSLWIRGMAAALQPALFFLIQREPAADGLYWFTAAAIYVLPLPFFLTDIRLMTEAADDRRAPSGFLPLTAFVAAASQEQYAAAILAVHLLITRDRAAAKKRVPVWMLQADLAAAAGFLFLYLSPGSYSRLAESSREKPAGSAFMLQSGGNLVLQAGRALAARMTILLRILGSEYTRYLITLLLLCAALAAYQMIREKKRKGTGGLATWLPGAAGAVCVCFSIMMQGRGCGLSEAVLAVQKAAAPSGLTDRKMIAGTGAVLLTGLLLLLLFLRSEGRKTLFYTTSGGIAALAVILASPEIPVRGILPFLLLLMPALGHVLTVSAVHALHGRRLTAVSGLLLLAGVFLQAAGNYSSIYEGYQSNREVILSNWRILEEAGRNNPGTEDKNQGMAGTIERDQNVSDPEERKGLPAEKSRTLYLRKHPDDRYGNIMPYIDGYEWVNEYIRAAFRLPGCTRIVWISDYG